MIKPLTSLRFFFAFMVFLSHFAIGGVPLFEGGHIGVSFFFMLSGFILTYSYKDKFEKKAITKQDFWIARIARIYPMHLATLIAALIVSVVLSSLGADYPVPNWFALPFNATLTQSFIPLDSFYFSFNAVSWSISDELFFYLMFPFIIFGVIKFSSKTIALVATTIICIYSMLLVFLPEQYQVSLFYINPLFRILDFLIGVSLFYLCEKMYKSNLFNLFSNKTYATLAEIFALSILGVFIYYSDNVAQVFTFGPYFWLPMAVVIFIFAQKNSTGNITRIFSWQPLVVLGEISFGFYMIHQLTIGVVMRFFNLVGLEHNLAWPVKFIALALITTFISWCSFKYFETPCNKWIKNRYQLYKSRANE